MENILINKYFLIILSLDGKANKETIYKANGKRNPNV